MRCNFLLVRALKATRHNRFLIGTRLGEYQSSVRKRFHKKIITDLSFEKIKKKMKSRKYINTPCKNKLPSRNLGGGGRRITASPTSVRSLPRPPSVRGLTLAPTGVRATLVPTGGADNRPPRRSRKRRKLETSGRRHWIRTDKLYNFY